MITSVRHVTRDENRLSMHISGAGAIIFIISLKSVKSTFIFHDSSEYFKQ